MLVFSFMTIVVTQITSNTAAIGIMVPITISTFQVIQDDGTKRVTAATDNGRFDVTPPYPYNTVVTLPAATTGATTLALTIRLDLLVETAPKSGSYYRSTALDTLTLPLLTNGAPR